MNETPEIVELKEDLTSSSLYSGDLAPVPKEKRTWSVWSLAALWVGMAVCIPTYLLASYMITTGLAWWEALIIIGLANLIITVPMVLNGHAGVKYGVPFPVIGRSSFGIKGIHIPSIVRGIVACGWFGVNTWLGGLAIYSIFITVSGVEPGIGFTFGQFVCFGVFWLLNMFFIWKGTDSIKWLEEYSAPILIFMGLLLIGWGVNKAGGFSIVLDQSAQLEKPVAQIYQDNDSTFILINPITDKNGVPKAESYRLIFNRDTLGWKTLKTTPLYIEGFVKNDKYQIQLKKDKIVSSIAEVIIKKEGDKFGGKIWSYLIWLTAMVGFWATMSLSIADITRFSSSQSDQVKGQFIGLPGTMMLYSFVGIFVTCAAVIDADCEYLGKYRKNHIPHTTGFWEKFFFKPGNMGYPVFQTKYAKVGVYICYDRHFPDGARALGLNGAEIVYNPSATVAGLSEYLWKLEQPAHAAANGYFMGCINRVGEEKPWNLGKFYGQSYFVDPRGQIFAEASRDNDELLIADFDLDMIEEVRSTWQFFRDRRPETYGDLVKL